MMTDALRQSFSGASVFFPLSGAKKLGVASPGQFAWCNNGLSKSTHLAGPSAFSTHLGRLPGWNESNTWQTAWSRTYDRLEARNPSTVPLTQQSYFQFSSFSNELPTLLKFIADQAINFPLVFPSSQSEEWRHTKEKVCIDWPSTSWRLAGCFFTCPIAFSTPFLGIIFTRKFFFIEFPCFKQY